MTTQKDTKLMIFLWYEQNNKKMRKKCFKNKVSTGSFTLAKFVAKMHAREEMLCLPWLLGHSYNRAPSSTRWCNQSQVKVVAFHKLTIFFEKRRGR